MPLFALLRIRSEGSQLPCCLSEGLALEFITFLSPNLLAGDEADGHVSIHHEDFASLFIQHNERLVGLVELKDESLVVGNLLDGGYANVIGVHRDMRTITGRPSPEES